MSGTITSSPGSIPNAASAMCSAPVQLEVAMACLAPMYAAKADSKRLRWFARVGSSRTGRNRTRRIFRVPKRTAQPSESFPCRHRHPAVHRPYAETPCPGPRVVTLCDRRIGGTRGRLQFCASGCAGHPASRVCDRNSPRARCPRRRIRKKPSAPMTSRPHLTKAFMAADMSPGRAALTPRTTLSTSISRSGNCCSRDARCAGHACRRPETGCDPRHPTTCLAATSWFPRP